MEEAQDSLICHLPSPNSRGVCKNKLRPSILAIWETGPGESQVQVSSGLQCDPTVSLGKLVRPCFKMKM